MDILQPRDHNVIVITLVLLGLIKLTHYWLNRPNARLVALKGPPNTSFLFGRSSEIALSMDRGSIYEQWANEYGAVYKVPTAFGRSRIILCDPKAAAHFHAKDTYTYVQVPIMRNWLKKFFGSNMLSSEGEDHRRQRRIVAPAFSIPALSTITNTFYESAYKVKAHWDVLFESTPEVTIDVQEWMNRITLDSIGIAGFGHDFGSIDGQMSPVIEAFNAFGEADQGFAPHLMFILGAIFPQVLNIPIQRIRLFKKWNEVTSKIGEELFINSRREKQGSSNMKDRSIIGLLVKGESTDADLKLSREEVVAHNLFLVAGYETTAVALTWALIELARNPHIQKKLREELRQFPNSGPTWEQLRSELPYLDAVLHETLRAHPPVEESSRVAKEDDVIPLSSPIETPSGEVINDSVFIPKGTVLSSPFSFFNRSESLWGPDAKQFVPERWLTDLTYPAKDIHGHRHLFTFADGPRICIGRGFALAEFKAVLSVLIRNFTFELTDGPDTKLEKHLSILQRPKVAGQHKAVLPMLVRQVVV